MNLEAVTRGRIVQLYLRFYLPFVSEIYLKQENEPQLVIFK